MKFKLIVLMLILISWSCTDSSGGGVSHTYVLPECYKTYGEINSFLYETASDHPLIAWLTLLGYSESGREIYGIVISDNPDSRESASFENEPEVRLTGGIHGSEPVSVGVLLKYIEYLTDSYLTDSTVADIVDSTYIVIIPLLNPDGYIKGRRYNSNNIDLNRNFSTAFSPGGSHGDSSFSESETRVIRDMFSDRIFHSSLTFHSGETVVNLPFDYDSENDGTIPLENDLVRFLGKEYSMSDHFLDTPGLMVSPYVEDGIVNGGNWYEIDGSLQDWSYLETGCIDLTIELSDYDPEDEAGLDEIYNFNRDSITSYILSSSLGVYGRVTDSGDNPLEGVSVSITGGDIVTKTDAEGYYYKILLGGVYELNFDKSGYSSRAENVTVPTDGKTNLDVILN